MYILNMPSAQTLPRTIIIKLLLVEQHMHVESPCCARTKFERFNAQFLCFLPKIPRRIMLKLGNHEADLVTSKHQAGSAKDW